MKKVLSLLLVALMLMSSLTMLVSADFDVLPDETKVWKPTNANWDAVEKGSNVLARFVIGADIHMDHYNSYKKLEYTYSASAQIGGVDALMIAGDLTHYGTDAEYAPLMEVINNYTKPNNIANPNATGNSVGATILSMGNHDFGFEQGLRTSADFKRNTGMDACALYWVNGVPVIALSPADERGPTQDESVYVGGNYDSRLPFLQQSYAAIAAVNYDGPVIVIAHHRTPNNVNELIDGSKTRNATWSNEILSLFKAHPETILFTGHSHTWIGDTQEFIVQNTNGFTHVRAGSLGNDYGETTGHINATTGVKETGLKDYDNDINCSAVLVDVMADGTTQLRTLDIAKGEYIFDEVFVIDESKMGYYNRSVKAGTYAEGNQAPVFAADAASKIKVEDKGNNSTVKISFPEATPATSSAKDAIDYYFIQLMDANGNAVTNGVDSASKYPYVKVGNYRHSSKAGTLFEVNVNNLAWDTDYTLTIWAENAYGTKSQSIVYNGTINVGHGTPTYPAKPVYDIDYSYGTQKDAQKHAIITTTNPLSKIVDDTTIGQKTMQFTRFGKTTSIGYDFQDADYRRIVNGYVLECYFNSANVTQEQALCGAWTGARLAFKINGGKVILYAGYLSQKDTEAGRTIASATITANTWYHVVAVYDGISTKLYLNGELRATNNNCAGGLKTSYSAPSDDPDAEDEAVKNERILFCVGSMDNSTDGDMNAMQNAKINKAALYEGVMTADDVALAYKIAKSNTGFTDVSDTWYIDSVEYAKAAGLMSGTGNGTTFEPNTKTTRAMIVQLLYALEGSPEIEYKSIYTDVTTKHWAKKAITWASDNGIAYGSGGKFNPDAVVTREQVAVFLYRYLKSKNVEMIEGADLSVFPDENKISTYGDLKDAMKWANAAGIVNGKAKNDGKTYLAPQDSATRAEAATMIVSFHKQFAGAIK